MVVDTMRRKLDLKEMNVDGTREMLIRNLDKCCPFEGVAVEGAGLSQINGQYVKFGTFYGVLQSTKGLHNSMEMVFGSLYFGANSRIILTDGTYQLFPLFHSQARQKMKTPILVLVPGLRVFGCASQILGG